MTEAAQARAAALAVEMKKDSLSQLQNGDWKITLKVAAQDMPRALLEALPGTRYQTAFVEVDDVEQPIQRREKAETKRPFHELPRPQQAGILCNDWRFVDWMAHYRHGHLLDAAFETPGETTAERVRLYCKAPSRATLDEPASADLWDMLVAEYRQDTGLEAAP